MGIHDPRQVVEDLRRHLAVHDRRLLFLFGAGTSCAVSAVPNSPEQNPKREPLIPGIAGLTAICSSGVCALGPMYEAGWSKLLEQCRPHHPDPNVENVLSNVRVKLDAIAEGETLAGLTREQLENLERTICRTIATTVSPSKAQIPESIPHDDLAAWIRQINRSAPLEVFTTNYDVLLERALEAARIPVFDGFVGTCEPFFYPESVENDALIPRGRWIRLWKLHGSINWKLELNTKASVNKRITRGVPEKTGEMILPSNRKYDESRKQPYVAYMDRLTRALSAEHALLVSIGYSFRDEHINAILYGCLDNTKSSNIIALQFEDLSATDPVVVGATNRANFTLLGPNAAVISGVFAGWQLNRPVDRKTSAFMDLAFDSNADPQGATPAAAVTVDLGGRMRLGDFEWFCRFLKAMGAD